jgi:diguanylate cyclase (GGDEF)-like protein
MNDSIYIWFARNLDVVFFVYGLAFFVMGSAIFVQPIGETKFKLANILWLLGWFGLAHGLNEWLDGWAVSRGRFIALDIARLLTLFISYLFLFEFGRRLVRLSVEKYPPGVKRIAGWLNWRITAVIGYSICILAFLSHDVWHVGAMLVRYFLGFPGGLLTYSGFYLYYKYEKEALEPLGVKRYFLSVSLAFLTYGLLGGLIVNKGRYFPSLWLNEESFMTTVLFPVQAVRAVCAIVAGWSTIGILRIFNLEKIKKLEEEITKRKQSEAEREKLNASLLKSNERLAQLALEDSHTGLYNFRYLSEIVEAELNRSKRSAQPLSVLMMDIDYFKSINDVYGHLIGDLVLKQFASVLKAAVRPYDIVARYGGEEFVIVSPQVSMESALVLGHRVLDAVNAEQFGNDEHPINLKVSIAVASYPLDFVNKGMDLIELADKILSKVKEKGGNRVYASKDTEFAKRPSGETGQEMSGINAIKDKIEKLSKRSEQVVIEAIAAFAKSAELKDCYTEDHVEKTVAYSVKIAGALGLSAEEVEKIRQGAMIHDLGKVGINERILNKPSTLNEAEFEKMKTHPQVGADIIRPIHSLRNIIPLIFYHHERWDGKGYPLGLKGQQIPLGARIIAVADVYKALTCDRSYRKSYTQEEAVRIISEGSGTQFDPRVVDVFLSILEDKGNSECYIKKNDPGGEP